MAPSTDDPRRPKNAEESLPPFLLTPPPPAPPRLIIRPLRPADIRPLHAACYPDHPFRAFDEACLRALAAYTRGRCFPLIATVQEAIVGRGQLQIYANAAEIADLLVAPAYRDQGIGTALIAVLTNIARHMRRPLLEIGVMPDNVRVLALYQRLGFTISREIRLPQTGKTGIILERLLVIDS